ncbi:hypothetical protein GCM10010529_15130 [Nesterenkonia aethiopica]|uniref:Uncharacterized protein n=1 Tax=Nesterenkonia aethiopica TaxID=269144 RepID=A0ABP6LVE3_9MICC
MISHTFTESGHQEGQRWVRPALHVILHETCEHDSATGGAMPPPVAPCHDEAAIGRLTGMCGVHPSNRAKTRQGLAVPPTIGRGETTISAPVGGSLSRF